MLNWHSMVLRNSQKRLSEASLRNYCVWKISKQVILVGFRLQEHFISENYSNTYLFCWIFLGSEWISLTMKTYFWRKNMNSMSINLKLIRLKYLSQDLITCEASLAVELESALLCTHAERVSFFISPIIPKLYPFVSARNKKEGHCWSSFLPMASYSSSSNFNKLNSGLKEGRDETSQCHWKGAHLSVGEADA